MNVFEMVALIVTISVAGAVLKSWIRQRRQEPDAAGEQRIARLEERVRALEAVVTDHGYDLRKQFKDLEGKP
jgi:hypothetical protein